MSAPSTNAALVRRNGVGLDTATSEAVAVALGDTSAGLAVDPAWVEAAKVAEAAGTVDVTTGPDAPDPSQASTAAASRTNPTTSAVRIRLVSAVSSKTACSSISRISRALIDSLHTGRDRRCPIGGAECRQS